MTISRTTTCALSLLVWGSLALCACNKGPHLEEATMMLYKLAAGAAVYYNTAHTMVPDHQFPESTPMSPSKVPCGEKHEPQQDDWAATTWQALNFSVSDPHYYAYQFDSAGVGPDATFTATAFGDADCDEVYSTFVTTGHVEGGRVVFDEEPTINDPEE